MIGYFNCAAIRHIRGLPELLEAPCQAVRISSLPTQWTYVAGWGRKTTACLARIYARLFRLPYLSLEDGFLRSYDLGVSGSPPHSVIVDDLGIYFDATCESRLERLILQTSDPGLLLRAQQGMALLRQHRLSKYNHAPDRPLQLELANPVILVVDQTLGDASVRLGGGSVRHFHAMLNAAIDENPGATILVKVHPDVLAGKKKSYLIDLAQQKRCCLIAEDISPWALLDQVDKVYVVTSQFGFEALIAGKEVHCFGLPFYAGWGLTQDRQSCPRRSVVRSLEVVFAAAYLLYPRYINPLTGKRCEFEETVQNLVHERAQH